MAAKEAEHQQVADAQGRAFRKHAGAGSVDVALLWLWARRLLGWGQVGAKAECGRCCLGGGRLGQRLIDADAAWAVAGWGRGW